MQIDVQEFNFKYAVVGGDKCKDNSQAGRTHRVILYTPVSL